MKYIFFKFSNYNKFTEGANMSKKENLLEKSPKLTVPEVIDYCKNDLGITFDLWMRKKLKNSLKKITSSSDLNSTAQPALNRQKAANISDWILGIWLNFLPLICSFENSSSR